MGNQLLIHSGGTYYDYKDPVQQLVGKERGNVSNKFYLSDSLTLQITVEFFRALDIRWLYVFVEKLQKLRVEQSGVHSSIYLLPHETEGTEERLSWKEYFTLFLEIGIHYVDAIRLQRGQLTFNELYFLKVNLLMAMQKRRNERIGTLHALIIR